MKKIFTYYSSKSSFPTISMLDFSNLCNECQILDKNILISTLDRLFIATNVELVDMDENPDNELCRFEMFEIFLRIVGAKYKDPQITQTYNEGLKLLLEKHLIPKSQTIQWQELRDKQLWTLEVNDTLDANLENLKRVIFYNLKVVFRYSACTQRNLKGS